MMTTTSSIGSTTNTTNNTVSSAITQSLGKYDFLKILAAELSHQDPTNPMDNKDFIAQMAQFSTLEQMQNMSDSFSSLKASFDSYFRGQGAGSSSAVIQAAGLIGMDAVAEVDGEEVQGTVEAVQFKDAILYAVIDGEAIPVSTITGLSAAGASQTEASPQDVPAAEVPADTQVTGVS